MRASGCYRPEAFLCHMGFNSALILGNFSLKRIFTVWTKLSSALDN